MADIELITAEEILALKEPWERARAIVMACTYADRKQAVIEEQLAKVETEVLRLHLALRATDVRKGEIEAKWKAQTTGGNADARAAALSIYLKQDPNYGRLAAEEEALYAAKSACEHKSMMLGREITHMKAITAMWLRFTGSGGLAALAYGIAPAPVAEKSDEVMFANEPHEFVEKS